ncbi:MAG: hypothetical protein Q7R65_01395 [bacterium]|nr:hypothetical protein [bacterium]
MNWKHWPYWLKGGVIGGGVTIISIGSLYTCTWVTTPGGFLCLPFLFISPMFPFLDLFDTNPYLRALPFSLEITSIIFWFLVGSLIGALVGHIKSKKKTTQ